MLSVIIDLSSVSGESDPGLFQRHLNAIEVQIETRAEVKPKQNEE